MTTGGRSRKKKSPQRSPASKEPGIAREERSAGGVVVRRAGPDTMYLIIRDCYDKWGFPKGHLLDGELPEHAALREVREETGLGTLELRGAIDAIDWSFRFRGQAIHKVCHFFLVETTDTRTRPQRAEGITACRWVNYEEAMRRITYDNARMVLERAREILAATPSESVASS